MPEESKKEIEKRVNKLKTRLKRTMEDMEDLELYTQDLLSFVPVGFCLLSGVGKIVNSNESFDRLTGYDLLEVSGHSLNFILKEKEKIKEVLKEAEESETVKNKEFTLISKDGSRTPISLSVSARRDQKGELIGYFIGLVDISDIKELQENLEKKVRGRTEELQERVDELEKFRKLVEGRELRMAELKEKNRELENKVEKLQEKVNRLMR